MVVPPGARCLVLGDFMLDEVCEQMSPPSPPLSSHGPLSVVATGISAGGAGTVARLLASATGGICVGGFVGDDVFGQLILDDLHRHGVLTASLLRLASLRSRRRVWVTVHGRPTMRINFEPCRVREDCAIPVHLAENLSLSDLEMLVINDFGKEFHLLQIPAKSGSRPFVVVSTKRRDILRYSSADLIFLNLFDFYDSGVEATTLPTRDMMRALAYEVRGYCPGGLVITAADAGFLWLAESGDERFFSKSVKAVVNSVGAGDTLVAATVAAMLRGMVLEDALSEGLLAASKAVEAPNIGLSSL